MRVTTPDVKTVREAVAAIEKQYDIVPNGIDDKMAAGQGGYRAVHMGIDLGDGKWGEIQVRTQNQSQWAYWAHDIVHKGPFEAEFRGQIARYAEQVSEALWKVDTQDAALKLPQAPLVLRRLGWEFKPTGEYFDDWLKKTYVPEPPKATQKFPIPKLAGKTIHAISAEAKAWGQEAFGGWADEISKERSEEHT